ncbi:MAG: hypothetical protein ACRDJN_25255 [Chloroflexota bacterium]
MIKTVVLIPIRDNAGRRFPQSLFLSLEERLLQFGGFSQTRNVVGAWQADGHTYRDVSVQYTCSLRSWLHLHAWLDVVLWAREQFRQKALYIEVAGVPEIVGGEDG